MSKLSRLFPVLTLAAFLLFLLVLSSPAQSKTEASTLFVAADGSGISCAADAPCALRVALAQAVPGDTIYMAGGNYTAPDAGAVATITKRLDIYGGWDGKPSTPIVRDVDRYPTIVDGEETHRGLFITSAGTVRLDGITIANGRVYSNSAELGGAGIYAKDTILLLSQVVISGNAVDTFDLSDSSTYGGGVAVEGGIFSMEDSLVLRNGTRGRVQAYGGGLSLSGTLSSTISAVDFLENDGWNGSAIYVRGESGYPVTILASTFMSNGYGYSVGSAYGGYGGAIQSYNADITLDSCRVEHNHAYNVGSAFRFTGGQVTIRRTYILNNSGGLDVVSLLRVSPYLLLNNVIANNTIEHANQAAINVEVTSDGIIAHNTIARNESGYGIFISGLSRGKVINTIIAAQETGVQVESGSALTITGILWGDGSWANGTDTVISGTLVPLEKAYLHGDPSFLNPDEGNYHLTAGSAAIDVGIEINVLSDIDGDRRPIGRTSDIGADEFRGLYLPLVMRNN